MIALNIQPKHFQTFKFIVYGLLVINTMMFFQEEWLAASYTFASGVPLGELISAFSATIDTAAWVFLLLFFELETFQVPHHKWVPPLSTTIHTARLFCYVFIVYAFYGYLDGALEIQQYIPVVIHDPCSLTDAGYSMLASLDEYTPLTVANCSQLAGEGLFRFADNNILATGPVLESTRWLAWVDVVNSATWILICVVLEMDVRLRDRNLLRGTTLWVSRSVKAVLYTTLFVAAVYWGFKGSLLDFWDAFLWLVAFVFIEMNVVQWNDEEPVYEAA